LSVLDEHFCAKWDAHGTYQRRWEHRRRGGATYRVVRYADDFVTMVDGERHHADALWDEVADVLAPMGLRLSEHKTRVCHIDEGFDLLGFHIQRRTKAGTNHKYVYTYPSKKALASIVGKVRVLTNSARNESLVDLLRQLNPALQGWCNYFRHAVSSRTFSYLDHYAWHQVTRWLLKRHKGLTWKQLYRRFMTARPWQRLTEDGIVLFSPQKVPITRYRWRATRIPSPWASIPTATV
jgi:RNA-directed DNA polymerase